MAKQLKTYFFLDAGSLSFFGKFQRFKQGHQPSQDTFQQLVDSVPFFDDSSSKAVLSAGGAIKDEQGLVVLATDTQAKANTAQLSDRSIVAQPSQLPTIIGKTSETLDDFTGQVHDSTADATTTRNNFVISFKAAFITWLLSRLMKSGGTTGQVLSKASNTNYDLAWISSSTGIPTGGNAGDILGKIDSTNGNVEWKVPTNLGSGGANIYAGNGSGVMNFRQVKGTANNVSITQNTNDVTIDLISTAVTPATYGSSTKTVAITVDQKGRITSASESNFSLPKVVTKASDTVVTSNTTLADDADLVLAIVAGEKWKIEYNLSFDSQLAGDLNAKYAMSMPIGTIFSVTVQGVNSDLSTTNIPLIQVQNVTTAAATSNFTNTSINTGSTQRYAVLKVTLNITTIANNGNVVFRYAQNTSSASTFTVKAGSSMTCIKG